MLAFIEFLSKSVNVKISMLEREKLKSQYHGVQESQSPRVTEFLVRYRRTYVLNKQSYLLSNICSIGCI